MAKHLVIVESPAKARTISRFLGDDYQVLASYGHVRDLPTSADEVPEELRSFKWAKLGVNIEDQFQPVYVIPGEKSKAVRELRAAAKGKTELLLATDEDREGESISWHILEVLGPKKTQKVRRIVFHEITPEAIHEALQNPRDVDERLVKAQETRRVLDRLYGYTLSPVLWRKVAPKLSAGRVQSVAVRLLVMRERERRAFVSSEYWGIEADLSKQNGEGSFRARLQRIDSDAVAEGADFGPDGQLASRSKVHLDAAISGEICDALREDREWHVVSNVAKPGVENPPVPFMTSTLQQEANRKLGFSARMTMQVAQQLYEGIDIGGEPVGLITYMRTDSLTLAQRAVDQARQVVKKMYGEEYLPAKPPVFKSKAKNAQEAHEAIRPTDLSRMPNDVRNRLTREQAALYELIWKRTLACQMVPARVQRTKVEVETSALGKTYTFGASGKEILFPGFLRAYVEGSDDANAELGDRERILPALTVDELLRLDKLSGEESHTRPPQRYTEASLVRRLEEEGIGRPSTYASILNTIVARDYCFRLDKQLVPTFKAFAVVGLLERHFGRLVDLGFTARLEDELDSIALGKAESAERLRAFYYGEDGLQGLEELVRLETPNIPFPAESIGQTEEGEPIVVRLGRTGPYVQRGDGGRGNTAFVPDDLPPAELTVEKALELIDGAKAADGPVGVDPESGRPLLVRNGPYGPYLTVEPTEEERESKTKPKAFKIPPGVDPNELSDEDLERILRFPRSLGKHPDLGEEVVVRITRFGGFVTCGEKKGNIPDWREASDASLERAIVALEEKPQRANREGPRVLRELRPATASEPAIEVRAGRFGPYVTNGTVNATLRKDTTPESISLDQALSLLKARAEAGPSKRRGPPTRASARKASPKRPKKAS